MLSVFFSFFAINYTIKKLSYEFYLYLNVFYIGLLSAQRRWVYEYELPVEKYREVLIRLLRALDYNFACQIHLPKYIKMSGILSKIWPNSLIKMQSRKINGIKF